jgi:hypothetical protein
LTFDLDRLHPALDLAVLVDLDLADALQIHPPLLWQPAGAVTIFGPLHTGEPGRALEPRKTRLLTSFDAAGEPLKGLVQPAQRGLLTRKRPHCVIRSHRPDLGQLR